MAYHVKEIFYTLQGEGAQTGRPAVFCRFSGCNLWSGRERDRKSAICNFCDTDFLGANGPGGGIFENASELAAAIAAQWPANRAFHEARFVVFTGGEPLLQLDEPVVNEIHRLGFETALETNGTMSLPFRMEWVCVSPKSGAELVLRQGDELKLVFPQPGLSPADFEGLPFRYFYLQPMDGVEVARNTQLALEYALAHPEWRLSLQTHKLLGIP